jgi:hypothetical protein
MTTQTDPRLEHRYIDVCNGDADGLCAIVQWRLHEPRAATLVTGLKREIALLSGVQAAVGDTQPSGSVAPARSRREGALF